MNETVRGITLPSAEVQKARTTESTPQEAGTDTGNASPDRYLPNY